MNKSFQIFSLFLFLTQICFGQWDQQNSGTTQNLNAVTFTDANNGFAVGDSGIILHTSNGGSTWAEQTSGTSLDLKDVAFVSTYQGWAVGGSHDEEGVGFLGGDSSVILHTSNGGLSWQTQVGGTGYGCFFDCCFIDANYGTVVGGVKDSSGYTSGNPVILHTTDGGVSWSQQNSPLPYATVISAVHFNNQNIGWMTAIAGSMGFESGIIKTTDGGLNWHHQITTLFGLYNILKRIKFSDYDNGFTVGWLRGTHPDIIAGQMFFTTDGGANWINADTSFFPTLLHPLNDIFLTGTNTAIAVGDSGDILQVTYAIGGWTEQASNTDSSLNGIYFVDELKGWVVGDGGTILHTTNGGNPVPVELNSFTATANDKEVMLSWSTATELNNQGFEVQRKFGTNDFVTIGSVKGHGTTTSPNNYTYIDKLTDAGKYFYRLKQIDFGGKYEYSQTVEVNWSPFTTYKLEQNYPNPFNPITTIGFGIPATPNPSSTRSSSDKRRVLVTLKIYDVLGNELRTLINEEMEAGYHSVDFNASDLPSGVYFYQLNAGSFIETRKMVLLR